MNLKKTLIIAITFVALFITAGYFINESAQIKADKEEHLMEIHRVETEEVERQRTERTEERSQFWQKAIPWGKDEVDQDD